MELAGLDPSVDLGAADEGLRQMLCVLEHRRAALQWVGVARMGGWPEITEPLLRERQGMSDEEFFEFLAGLLEAIGTRELEDEHYERAIAYPLERPPGSCLVTDEGVEDLADIDASRRKELVGAYVDESANRVPLLAYGANGSPKRLALKLAHLPDGDREALILAGDLEDFDVGRRRSHPYSARCRRRCSLARAPQ
jgi:hypothetical protein